MPNHAARTLSVLTPLLGLAGLAGADMPRALDLIPADAPLVIATDDMGELIDDINTLNRALGPHANAELNLGLAFIGNMPGLDKDGSLAVILMPRDMDVAIEEEMEMMGEEMDFEVDVDDDMTGFVIAPVSDFAAFTTGWKNGPNGVKVGEFDGNPIYARDLDGDFAMLGPDMEVMNLVQPAPGQMGKIKNRIGPVSTRLAEATEVLIFGDPALLKDGFDEGSDDIRENAEMASAMGGVNVSGTVNTVLNMTEEFMRDGQAFALGFSLTETGILLDAVGQFQEGSETAKKFEAEGRSGTLASRLPAQDHYAAWALDMKHPYVEHVFDQMPEGERPTLPGDVGNVLSEVTGLADVIGVSPGGLTGGLLRRQVRYIETANPEKMVKSLGDSVAQADGTSAGGMSLTSSFAPDAEEVAGVSVATYDVKLAPDPDATPGGLVDMTQVMPALFGGSGPRGYLAATETGVVQTLSRHGATLESALNAARFGEGLTSTDGLQNVLKAMPSDRFAEFYLRVDEVGNAAGPMAMFMGLLEDFEPIDALPPIAGALTGTEGGLHARLIIPTELIPVIVGFIPEEQEPAMLEEDERRGGRPSF